MPSCDKSDRPAAIQSQRHKRFDNQGIALEGSNEAGDDVSVSILQKMLSAISGSIITSLLVTPLDVVRVRLQSQHPTSTPPVRPGMLPGPSTFSNVPSSLGISSCCREVFWVTNNADYCVIMPASSSPVNTPSGTSIGSNMTFGTNHCAAEEAHRRNFTSTLDGLRKIARHEGARTLWRGLSPTLIMAVPANVIYFAGYDWLRYNHSSPFARLDVPDIYTPLAAGSSARVLAAVAVSPIEMLRTRMQAAHAHGLGGSVMETARSLRRLVRERGVKSLWTGLGLTLWRDVPFSAIYWWGYEYGRNWIQKARDRAAHSRIHANDNTLAWFMDARNHAVTLVDSFLAGASSGAVAAFVTTPFDVGKTRQQVVQHGISTPSTAASTAAKPPLTKVIPEQMVMPRFLLHIFETQGLAGLFKGWAARCLKVAPACAIMISSYEIGKKMALGINERHEQTETQD